VVQIGVLALFARLLSPNDFGLAGLATIFSAFVSLVAQFGLRVSIVQRVVITDRDMRAGFTLAMLLGLGGTVLLALTAQFAATLLDNPAVTNLVVALSLTVLLANAGLVAEALLHREMAWGRLMWADIGSYLLGFAATGTILALMGLGPWALVGSILGQNMLRTLFLLGSRPHPKRPLVGGKEFRELFRVGGVFTAARLFNYGAQQGDNLVVGGVLGTTELGFYSRAFKLMMIPVTHLGTIATRVLFPAMARLQHDAGQLRTAYLTGCAALALASGPISVLTIVAAPELVQVVLGAKWEAAIVPLQILSGGLMLRNVSQMSYCLDGALGAMWQRAARDAVYALAVIGGSLAGARYGLPGVAAGVLGASLIHYILAATMSQRLLRHSWPEFFASQSPALVLAIASMAPAIPLRLALHALGLPAGVVLSVTALVTTAFVALLVFFRPTIVGKYGRIALRNLGAALSGKLADRGLVRWDGWTRQLTSRWEQSSSP
ncbi:MAG: lipopolysaccharide biosynthesis protein, partial [Gemmatimonadota bacterium]|nr:lipopolysaccharide biosynthesis protein [Gemmatimonadota bacterium]